MPSLSDVVAHHEDQEQRGHAASVIRHAMTRPLRSAARSEALAAACTHTCPRCHEFKPHAAFNRHAGRPCDLYAICTACRAARRLGL